MAWLDLDCFVDRLDFVWEGDFSWIRGIPEVPGLVASFGEVFRSFFDLLVTDCSEVSVSCGFDGGVWPGGSRIEFFDFSAFAGFCLTLGDKGVSGEAVTGRFCGAGGTIGLEVVACRDGIEASDEAGESCWGVGLA